MSQEEVVRFGKALQNDPELLSTVQSECKNVECLAQTAQEKGYDFTVEDFTAYVEKNAANSEGKLGEEQLEKVAGGAVISGIVDASAVFSGII